MDSFWELLPQIIVNSLISGGTYALVAAGLSLAYGVARVLNFAHGHMMMVGGYFFFAAAESFPLLLPNLPWGWMVALCSAVTFLGMALLGVLAEFIFVRPFAGASSFLVLVATLCLGTILEATISLVFGVNVKSIALLQSDSSFEFFGAYITPLQITMIVLSLGLLGGLALVIAKTRFGIALRACSEHPHAAAALGVPSKLLASMAIALSSVLAGVGGVLVGSEFSLQPTMGGAYMFKAFAAMILGGLGNIGGTIAGAFILGFIENFAVGIEFNGYSLPSGYKDAFAFLIILLMLIFRPQGLFGVKARAV